MRCGIPLLTALIALAGCGADGADPEPLANVFRINPVEDSATIQVPLRHLTGADGALSGRYADVWNCVDRPGRAISVNLGAMSISGKLCTFERTALPGAEGNYLQITPPEEDAGDNAFSEVMMYHHITALHDHYHDSYGITHIDKPIRAIVNIQGYVEVFNKWIGLPNANYIPVEHAELLKQIIGIDILDGSEALVFGYNNISPQIGQVNFSFDAMTIYHEYTHFTLGGSRLLQPAVDRYGPDSSPIALNEALADYFPSSYLDTSLAGGTYTLGKLARNLDNKRRCPDDMTGETHIDGEVASGAFWEIRRLLGPTVADQVLWDAALSFTLTTSFDQAARAILDEVKRAAPAQEAAARGIFEQRGLLGCDRLREHRDYDNNGPMAAYSPMVEGRDGAPAIFAGAKEGVPGYVQYRVHLGADTREVSIEYTPLVGSTGQGAEARGDVSLAVRRGSDPITYTYASGEPASSAHLVLKGQAVGEKAYRLTLSGPCLVPGGDLVFQLVNNGRDPATITSVKVTQRPTVTNPVATFHTCQ